jgi:hypothetical protein
MLKTVSSVTNAIGALNYKGTWNATTNTPTITSSVGVKGDYYQVSVAGSTTINGISNWGVGDVIAFNGVVWQRIEGGADLNGVNLSVSGTTTLSGLTASTALALNAGKDVVSVTNTGTDNNVLSTSPSITTPRVITSINDTNGNEIIGVTATASAVNELTVANAATGNNPVISATGSDTNIGITLTPKGTGNAVLTSGNLVVANGNGIDFSATSGTGTSELLDDYEEGTFDPTLTTDGTNFTSVTYSSERGGKYVKVGNVVHFQLTMRTSAVTVGSASGNVLIGGLPFTASASSGGTQNGNAVAVGGVSVSWVTNNPVFGVVQNNSTNILLYNAQAATTTVVANVGTGAGANYLQLTGTYVSA